MNGDVRWTRTTGSTPLMITAVKLILDEHCAKCARNYAGKNFDTDNRDLLDMKSKIQAIYDTCYRPGNGEEFAANANELREILYGHNALTDAIEQYGRDMVAGYANDGKDTDALREYCQNRDNIRGLLDRVHHGILQIGGEQNDAGKFEFHTFAEKAKFALAADFYFNRDAALFRGCGKKLRHIQLHSPAAETGREK